MSAAAEVITETGAFCVGRNRLLALNGSWPFGRLEIHPDRLVLDTLFRRYTFSRHNIVSLSISSRFSRAVFGSSTAYLNIHASLPFGRSTFPEFDSGCSMPAFLFMTPRSNQALQPTATRWASTFFYDQNSSRAFQPRPR
jgi:hypothetical protein